MNLKFDALEAKKLIKLAIPIFLGGIANVGMGFADSVMAGQVSAEDLAGISLAVSIIILLILPASGVMMAVTPVISKDHGASDYQSIPNHFYQLFYIGIILSIITMLIMLVTKQVIPLFNLSPKVQQVSQDYILVSLIGIPFLFGFNCLRSLTEGVSYTKITMIVSFIGLAFNVVLNYIFIYGKFGSPALGGVGCAVATATVQILMFVVMLLIIKKAKALKKINIFIKPPSIDMTIIKHYIKIGIPIIIAVFFEVGLFSFFSFVTVSMGTAAMAANQIFFNYMTLLYILPMSLSQVVSIRIGYSLGQKNIAQTKVIASTTLIIGIAMALVVAILSYIYKTEICHLYSNDDEVITIVSSAFICVCVYQLGDYCQTIGIGILRGLQDNKIITYASIIVYWLIAVPLGLALAFTIFMWGPHNFAGLWMGLCVALYILGVVYLYRVNFTISKLEKEMS